jgi:hypothetical protein
MESEKNEVDCLGGKEGLMKALLTKPRDCADWWTINPARLKVDDFHGAWSFCQAAGIKTPSRYF